jgi:hypothetical protein
MTFVHQTRDEMLIIQNTIAENASTTRCSAFGNFAGQAAETTGIVWVQAAQLVLNHTLPLALNPET